ncbi:MAG TPA: SIMPL domain-containing protein [Gemmatimonadaceae bacterium]
MNRFMPWLIVPGLLLAAPALSAQRVGGDVPPSVITVSAQGEIQVVPDRAYVLVSVQTRSSSAAAAAGENANKQTAVITSLRSLGVKDSQISTQNYTVVPETRNDNLDHTPRIVSYLVSNSLRVEVTDLATVGKVIDSALSHGANQVSSVDFFESQAVDLYRKALAEAVANAKAQAEIMASAAGGHLGSLLELNSSGVRMPSPMFGAVRMAGVASSETPIMPGQDTIEASVTAKWVFVPNE